MNKLFKYSFMFLFFTLAGALSGAPQAQAASSFDDHIVLADDFIINSADGLLDQDLSNWWEFVEPTCASPQMAKINAVMDDIANNISPSAYMAKKYKVGVNEKRLAIIFSKSGEINSYAELGGTDFQLYNYTQAVVVWFALNNDNTLYVACQDMDSSASWTAMSYNSPSGYKPEIIFSTFPLIQPDGYEGVIPPETWSPEGDHYNEGTEYTPSFSYDVKDKVLKVTDVTQKNFIETYKISKCMFQLPNNLEGDNFVEVEFDCMAQPTIEHEVEENGSHNIILRHYSEEKDLWYETTKVIDMNGSHSGIANKFEDEIMTNCFKQEIPYVDFEGCINTLKKIGNLLSFGMFKFGNSWSYTSGCSNLSVLDDWLGLTTSYVCPRVPEHVRNGVTPFVTFILGLITVRFIAKQGGDSF